MPRTARYGITVRVGALGSPNRPFASNAAIDCTPPRLLRWYHVAAVSCGVLVLAAALARMG